MDPRFPLNIFDPSAPVDEQLQQHMLQQLAAPQLVGAPPIGGVPAGVPPALAAAYASIPPHAVAQMALMQAASGQPPPQQAQLEHQRTRRRTVRGGRTAGCARHQLANLPYVLAPWRQVR